MRDAPWAIALIAAAVSWLAVAALARAPWIVRLADHPNERSLHATPTPRIGGLGIGLGVAVGAFVVGSDKVETASLLVALALLALSLADDVRSLPASLRLAAHVAAAIAATLLVAPDLGPAGLLAAVLAIAWSANLFNFMDGADGLAGGMAAFGFAFLGVAAGAFGEVALATTCMLVAAASAGFLAHNFPPARVFMGDAGSIPLGFLGAALGLSGWVAGAWPPWFPFLVFSPFAVDATFTLLRRALARERVWQAHRSHLYQRLVLSGWSHRRLALWAYALMLAAGCSALAARREGFMVQCVTILAWAALYALLAIAIQRHVSRQLRDRKSAPPGRHQ